MTQRLALATGFRVPTTELGAIVRVKARSGGARGWARIANTNRAPPPQPLPSGVYSGLAECTTRCVCVYMCMCAQKAR